MMSAYNKDRAAGLFFVSFLLIGMFFLLNFVLALVSNLYAEQVGALCILHCCTALQLHYSIWKIAAASTVHNSMN